MSRFTKCAALLPLIAVSGLFAAVEQEPNLESQKADTIPIPKVADVEPAPKETMMATIKNGVDFLLTHQNKNGSWGDHTGSADWSVTTPYPSGPRTFRTASTALCVIGLDASPLRDDPKVVEAMTRAEDFLLEEMPKLKRGDTVTIYNVWAHSYVLEMLARRSAYLDKESARYKAFQESARHQIKWLNTLADVRGGWGYYDFDDLTQRPSGLPTSFLTATALIAIKEAEDAFKLEPDPKVFARALQFLKNQRTPAGTYVYSVSHQNFPHKLINRHTGSLARSPACDYAIKLYEPDYISTRQLLDGIERLWSRTGWLTMSLKKPIPHESFAQNSGYFVFYGYYYIASSFGMLPKSTLKRQASQLVDDLIPMQEKDGSWWDFPIYNYHKFYGTGYALFAMSKGWDILYGKSASLPAPSSKSTAVPSRR